MARERKCILCHFVYSSKKEMEEHMRSMLHHRELENLKGRDCEHECRVCRVTLVGLSTYAKHISSQLHKANVNALDKEDDAAEEAEEVYFDKELIQLINKRKEQSRKKEECSSTKDQEAERYQRRREERPVFQEMAHQNWRCDPSPMPWQRPNDCFNAMPDNLLHPSVKLGHNLHLPGPRGSAGWHLNGLPNHLANHGNLGGSWHSNAGGPTSWHHRGSGRNYHWHQEGNGNLSSMMHPKTCGGNWQPNPYNGNQWNFSNAAESFPQTRNRPVRHCDSTQDKEKSCDKTNNTFSKEKCAPHHNTRSCKVSSEKPGNRSSKKVPEDSLSKSKTLEKSSNSSTAKPTCLAKGSNATKDKTHRWTPYPQQKGAETSHTPEPDLPSQVTASRNGEKKPDQTQNVPKAKDKVIAKTRDVSGKKAEQSEPKRPRMPLRHAPDPKPSAIKRDQRNPLKGIKLQSPVGERQNKQGSPNLETLRSASHPSGLHGASQNTSDVNQENGQKEAAETLGDVLRKAKEMLENSQCLQSPYFPSMKDAGVGLENSTTDHRDNHSAKDPVQPTSPTADHDGTKMDNVLQAKSTSSAVHSPSNSESSLEQVVPNTVPDASQTESTGTDNSTEHLDAEGSRITHEGQDFRKPGKTGTVSESELQKGAASSSSAILPELSKLGLPASLRRDLSRHISSRSKTGTHLPEPNLNNARRIRNVSGHRKSETEKDSGIKPTLRHILNASRRNINWEQVMHHVMKKKQELGKGLPRFGIEMVAPVQSEQEGLDFDKEANLGIESFHWEGTSTCPLSTRKRSLSESSVTDKASVYIFTGHGSDTRSEQSSPATRSTPAASGLNVSSTMMRPSKQEEESVPIAPPEAPNAAVPSDLSLAETSQSELEDVKTHTASDGPHVSQGVGEDVDFGAAGGFTTSTPVDAATDSCASCAEQNDGQGAGKKRRATGDGSSCPEIPSLERNSKKRKIKSRKERSQVDQLLSISLREEELNNSLLGVENSLQQARTALQNACIEVQRLMVVKQKLALEMSTMRTQRIQILQGLQQGSSEPASKISKQVNSQEPATPVVSPGSLFSFLLETPYVAPQASPLGSALLDPGRAFTPPTPQASSVAHTFPDSSGSIKQEPNTPEMEEDNMVTSPDQADPPRETNGEACRNSSIYPIITATMSLSELTRGFPQLDMPLSVDGPTNSDVPTTSMSCSSTNIEQPMCNSEIQSVFPERPSHSQPQEANSCSPRPPEEPRAESTFNAAENKAGKKKKKLRKKKTLRAAHVPENSDTEQDTCTSKPIRKVRVFKLSKETAVSTSTSLGQELGSEKGVGNPDGGNCDSDSSIELVEIPRQQLEVVPIDSHSDDDDDKPGSPPKMDVVSSMGRGTEANDEVTSTSELGSNYTEEPNVPINRIITRSKNSSDVSSEPGEDDDPTEGSFEGHHASVNAIQIFEGLLYTCSADKTVRAYNLVNRQCMGVFEGHTSKVNCLLVTQTYRKSAMLFTGSSDHTICCYSVKTQKFVERIDVGERVLCLHVRWRILYAGLGNGTVVTFSLKNNKQIDVFECHGPRAVSCLATAQEGARRLLLVGSYDCTISVRDARNGLLLRTLEGHTKTVLCMKVVNDLVFSGSSDQTVHAHNIHTGELVRIYKGHNHAVTVVNILGKVMVTASLDKLVRVYELQSHDRLQVYGGHSDMIMCMAIHKSMIYTGCYDGSVQAVRLNLMQNYRCGWHGCSLIFGVVDHLKQHLLTDHTNPNFQTLKCRWKNCDAFFTARRGSKQDAAGHMERHADEDSRLDI